MKRAAAVPLGVIVAAWAVGLAVSGDLAAATAKTVITLDVSKPANGSCFVVGEKPVVSVILPAGVSKGDLATLSLYLYGPQETLETAAAVKLLNASADRSAKPHHYIDLLTNSAAAVNGNVLTYQLQAVSDEKAGTYTATLWAVSKSDALDQAMSLVDFQIGTGTAEMQIVDKSKCAKCHLGADNGQFYFAHVDPGHSPTGSPSLDSWPVRTCKSCHNTNGYAAYTDPANKTNKIPDPIVNRVHGIHMGEHLKNPRNVDPNTGVFRAYADVVFPADVKNCTTCHTDDRWKTQPSRLACGACHDNVWFGIPANMPQTGKLHAGGEQPDDKNCSSCHPADGNWVKGMLPAPVAAVHKVNPPAFKQTVELALSKPANGVYYVAGEKPQATITVKDAATGAVINPATIIEPADAKKVAANEWKRANLYVSGPRARTVPVLTSAAADADPGHYYANNDFRVRRDPKTEDPRVTRSATAITYQLGNVAGLEPGTYTAFVEIVPAAGLGGLAVANFQVGTDKAEPMVATNCTDCHGDTRMHASYFAVPFNPDICKSCHDYLHQATGKTGWKDSNWGFGAAPLSRRVHGVHFGRYLDKPAEINPAADYSHVIFPQDVRNCTKCHANNPAWKQEPSRLACLACHDSDDATAHGKLMTYDLTPNDPYDGDEVETCTVCHGADSAFAPNVVHNISDPYKPPYPREPQKDK